MITVRQHLFGIALIAASATCSCRSPLASSPEFLKGYAIVRQIHGTATYTSPWDKGALPLGKQLVEGYQISTGPNSFVDLDLGLNGDALRIQENGVVSFTELKFRRGRPRPTIHTAIKVDDGSVILNVGRPLSRSSRYWIRTTNFTAGAREGRPGCAVGQDGVTSISGHLRVTPIDGGGIGLTVSEGTTYQSGDELPTTASAESLMEIATTAIQSLANTGNKHSQVMVEQSIQDRARSLAIHAAVSTTDEKHIEAAARKAVSTVRVLAQAVIANASTGTPPSCPPTSPFEQPRIKTEALAIQAAADAAGLISAVRSYEQHHDLSRATSIGLAAAKTAAAVSEQLILSTTTNAEAPPFVREETRKAVSNAPKRARRAIQEFLMRMQPHGIHDSI